MSTVSVFLSHSHKDNDWCSTFVTYLRQEVSDVWYDKEGIYIGSKWRKTLESELERRDIFVLIITPDSWNSEWVQDELSLALSLHKRIIGVYHKSTEVKGFLLNYQLIDLIGQDAPSAANVVARIVLSSIYHAPIPRIPIQEPFKEAYHPPAKSYSRRGILIGSGVVAGTLLGGVILKAIGDFNRNSSPSTTSHPPNSSSTNKFTPGTTLYTYSGHSNPVLALAWSPDGTRIASGGVDQSLHIWDAENGGNARVVYNAQQKIRQIDWSSKSNLLVFGSEDGTVGVYDPNNFHMMNKITYPSRVRSVCWSPDEQFILLGGASQANQVQVWDANLQQKIHSWTAHPNSDAATGQVTSVSWSPDGKWIVTTSDDTTARIWDAQSTQLLGAFTQHTDRVYQAAWAKDSNHVATTGLDGTVHVWNPQTQQNQITYKYPQISDASQGPRPLYAFPVSWSLNSTYIAFGGGDDEDFIDSAVDTNIYFWDWQQGRIALTYKGHQRFVDAITWSPDGTRIASAGDDALVRIWQAR